MTWSFLFASGKALNPECSGLKSYWLVQKKSLLGTTKELKCHRETVTRWRKRWVERSDELPEDGF